MAAAGCSEPDHVQAEKVRVALPGRAVSLSTGWSSSCAVLEDGRVSCWGAIAPGNTPALVAGVDDAVQVAVGQGYGGGDHACALIADGSVRCWGNGERGQLGDDSLLSHDDASTVVDMVDAHQIATGLSFSCAVHGDDELSCWGAGRPAPEPILADVLSVTTNYGYTCAVRSDRSLVCREEASYTSDPTEFVGVGLAQVVSVSGGSSHVCALLEGGQVWCWGDNSLGQIGVGVTETETPRRVDDLGPIAAVASGNGHTCALEVGGRVYCWGDGDNGALGQGCPESSAKPVAADIGGVVAISAGDDVTCALDADGRVWCWGWEIGGRLGR